MTILLLIVRRFCCCFSVSVGEWLMTGKWMVALGNVVSACLRSADNCLLDVSSGL